jgi:hypothetical protein
MAVADHYGRQTAQVLSQCQRIPHDAQPLTGVEKIPAVVRLHIAGKSVFANDPEGNPNRIFAQDGQSRGHRHLLSDVFYRDGRHCVNSDFDLALDPIHGKQSVKRPGIRCPRPDVGSRKKEASRKQKDVSRAP